MSPLEDYFEALPEDYREVMLVVRDYLRAAPYGFEEKYKWDTPTYYAGGRYVCYLYYRPKARRAYLGFGRAAGIAHPLLLAEGRAQIRILVLDPGEDVPLRAIGEVLALLGYGKPRLRLR